MGLWFPVKIFFCFLNSREGEGEPRVLPLAFGTRTHLSLDRTFPRKYCTGMRSIITAVPTIETAPNSRICHRITETANASKGAIQI